MSSPCQYCSHFDCDGCYNDTEEELDYIRDLDDAREPEEEPEPDYGQVEDDWLNHIHGDCP